MCSCKPEVSHLRSLGCISFAKNLSEYEKLMPRSRSSVYIGTKNTEWIHSI